MGFTVTLPSNSSEGYYPDNTISSFKTHLPEEISLETEYEVALTEIQYTNSFYNLPEDSIIDIRLTEFQPLTISSLAVSRKVKIKKGYYKDIEQFINLCKSQILRETPTNLREKFDFRYQEVSRKIKVIIPSNTINYRLIFSPLLQAILGFGKHPHTRTQLAQRAADINACVHSMFIYSNIVAPRIVGDAMVPLLRVIAVHGTHNEYVVENFYHLQYTPVRLRNFQTIEIDLRNNLGTAMPFHSGEAILSLHFRRTTR